jgi:tRNA(Ile)-lysidine synthase
VSELLSELRQQLDDLPPVRRYLIAFSGGLDSTALLHALVALGSSTPLLALHLNHGLHPDAEHWHQWCRCRSESLGVDFLGLKAQIPATPKEGLEAAARKARYEAFADVMVPGDVLLTAHHQDDQAETLLLNLLRGSGPAGLAAMPPCRSFASGYLARPLLGIQRQALQEYLVGQGIDWLEDPSNTHEAFDRNFLRHSVMPLLKQRWPSASATMARSASLCAETDNLQQSLAEERLSTLCPAPDQLDLPGYSTLPMAQRRWLMRAWLKRQGCPMPNSQRLEEMCTQLVDADEDRNPQVAWASWTLRRYRQRLYLLPQDLPWDISQSLVWSEPKDLKLPGNGWIRLSWGPGGLSPDYWQDQSVRVSYRQGGEQCQRRHKPLKQLLQEAGIPPWQRDRVPLVFSGDRLVAVAGLGCCVEPADKGWRLYWHSGTDNL